MWHVSTDGWVTVTLTTPATWRRSCPASSSELHLGLLGADTTTSGDEPLAGHSARLERALRAHVAHPAQSKKGAEGLMETATDGLRKRVMKVKGH